MSGTVPVSVFERRERESYDSERKLPSEWVFDDADGGTLCERNEQLSSVKNAR